MKFLYKDKDGNNCAAKFWFALTMVMFLADVGYSRYNLAAVDFSGWAAAIAAIGAAYGWRSHTKAAK